MLEQHKIHKYSTNNQYLFKNIVDVIGIAYVLRVQDSHVLKKSDVRHVQESSNLHFYEHPVIILFFWTRQIFEKYSKTDVCFEVLICS